MYRADGDNHTMRFDWSNTLLLAEIDLMPVDGIFIERHCTVIVH